MGMKTGAASGCLVWLLTFFVVSLCLCPVAAMVGGITSATNAGDVAGLVGPWLCPADTTPEIFSYQTTITDESGFESPATGYELHCLSATGELVRNVGPAYAFAWVGLLAAAGLVLAAALAVVLAVPAGALIARLTRRPAQHAPSPTGRGAG
jgi:hypothetical protein